MEKYYNEEIIERLKKIADHYGLVSQIAKLNEELGELSSECGYAMIGKMNENIYSEIADVLILISQIEYLLGCSKKVNEQIEFKTRRQIQRIDREEQEKNM